MTANGDNKFLNLNEEAASKSNMGNYIKWYDITPKMEFKAEKTRDAPGVEVIQPGEQEKIKEVSDQFNRFQMMNFNEHHHCLRGTHLKTQGVCSGF